MGNIVKLVNAGDTLTMRVTEAEEVAGNFGQQAKFVGEDGSILYLPLDSATRQLDRIPLTVAGAVGETLTFSRDPNPKPGAKPYWGIRVADAVDRSQPAEPRRVASPYQGKPIAGLDDFTPADADYAVPPQEHMPPRQAWMGASGVTGEGAKVAPNSAKRAAILDDYVALVRHVAQHSGLTDQQAIQAAAATIFIAWDKAGVR